MPWRVREQGFGRRPSTFRSLSQNTHAGLRPAKEMTTTDYEVLVIGSGEAGKHLA
jgi:hypothetical protein